MTDTQPTATAAEPVSELTEAMIPGEFWQAMNFVVQKAREAWSIGSAAMLTPAEKERTRRLLDVVIAQAEYAKDLMS